MEGITLRAIELGELETMQRVCARALGFSMPGDDFLEHMSSYFDTTRSLAAFDGAEMIGTAHSWLFDWTVPGGVIVPAAGVTLVSVAATQRRRGIATQMMRRQLAEARDRGEPVAILLASESVIYGRYGYGLSTTILDVELDPRVVELEPRVEITGRVRFVDDDAADKTLPGVYDRWRRAQPGAIGRDDDWWKGRRIGRKPNEQHYVVYERAGGEVDGYAIYSVRAHWDAGLPDHTVNVQEHVAVTDEASAALWTHLLGIDLASRVQASVRPPDEPLRWMLSDPRRLKVTRMGDFLWARVLDVSKALSARRYSLDGRLVLRVADAMFPDVDGTYELDAGRDGADCVATTADPDLSMGIAELGAVYQGGVRFSDLARVGRVREQTTGALARADAMFASSPLPWSNTGF